MKNEKIVVYTNQPPDRVEIYDFASNKKIVFESKDKEIKTILIIDSNGNILKKIGEKWLK